MNRTIHVADSLVDRPCDGHSGFLAGGGGEQQYLMRQA